MRRTRNTSTHVEKTLLQRCDPALCGKHLHARGENRITKIKAMNEMETPPRTWRKRRFQRVPLVDRGNTSTHVEKTQARRIRSSAVWKHLHARGENRFCLTFSAPASETPPRTWRKLNARPFQHHDGRNTSTHVEKTDKVFENGKTT